jgi:hypothetical protein
MAELVRDFSEKKNRHAYLDQVTVTYQKPVAYGNTAYTQWLAK